MATPGFGFSAGDFIAAATLIVKVSKALKDTGGAKAEYQALVIELNRLQKLLIEIQRTSSSSTSNPATTADNDPNDNLHVGTLVEEQIKATISEVTDFLNHLSKFESSLGQASKAGWHRSIPRKAQWAVHYTSEVEQIRTKLQTQLDMILLVLQLGLSFSMRSATEQIARRNPVNREDLEDIIRGEISALRTAFPLQLDHANEQHQALLLYNRTSLESARDFGLENSSRTREFEARIDRTSSCLIQQSNEAGALDRCTESTSLRHSQSREPAQLNGLSNANKGKQKASTQTTADTSRSQSLEKEGVSRLMLALLRAIVTDMGKLVSRLKIEMPYWIAFLHSIHFTLLREPMLAHADCIMFEDMMGQGVTLDYRYYRDWKTFETFLLKRFSSGPGHRHVVRRMYQVMWNDTVVENSKWSKAVQPGSRITMFGLVPGWKTTGESCPKPGCYGEGSRRGNTSHFECIRCGVVYAGYQSARGFVEGQLKGDDCISKSFSAESGDLHVVEETLFRRVNVTWDGEDVWSNHPWSREDERLLNEDKKPSKKSKRKTWIVIVDRDKNEPELDGTGRPLSGAMANALQGR